MQWIKHGLLLGPEALAPGYTHAQLPLVEILEGSTVRVYFASRDGCNRSYPFCGELDLEKRGGRQTVHGPLMELGSLGAFDDDGVMPSSLVQHENRLYLYYTGWNRRVSVPYHTSIGLAERRESDSTFHRVFDGPVVERSREAPYACMSPWVLIHNGRWKMWYVSVDRWVTIDDKVEPIYHIRYAESGDGLHWQTSEEIAISLIPGEGGVSRPSVIIDRERYRMWYAVRGVAHYRTNQAESYRLGYAESTDGRNWTRLDDSVGIDRSPTGWDSEMMSYPNVFSVKGQLRMLYNGNGFGRSGIGYAVLEE